MVISRLVCLLQFVIQQLRMVNAESPMLTSHPHNLVNDVESMFWDCSTSILLTNHLTDGFKFGVFDLECSLQRCSAKLGVFLFLYMFIDIIFTLHQAVKVLLDYSMGFSERCALWSLTM